MQLNSEAIDQIATALAKAQITMKTPEKDKQNPHFKNKYASLGSILSASKSSLNSNGISVTQQLCELSGKHYIATTLLHASGQWIRSYMVLRLDDKATAQQMGSFLTYAKRYSLCAILAVDADEDDDGELASQAPKKKEASKEDLPRLKPLGPDEVDYLKSILHPDDLVKAVDFCKKQFKTDDLRFMARETYDKWVMRAKEKLEAEVGHEG